MPTFRITIVDANFTACTEQDLPSLEAAREQGVKAAFAIGVDEVAEEPGVLEAEVRVQSGDSTLGRFLVSMGYCALE